MKIVKSWNISLSYKNNIFQIYFYISLLLINLFIYYLFIIISKLENYN